MTEDQGWLEAEFDQLLDESTLNSPAAQHIRNAPLTRACNKCYALPGTVCVVIDNESSRRAGRSGSEAITPHHIRRDHKIELWPWTYRYWIDEMPRNDRHRMTAFLRYFSDVLINTSEGTPSHGQ